MSQKKIEVIIEGVDKISDKINTIEDNLKDLGKAGEGLGDIGKGFAEIAKGLTSTKGGMATATKGLVDLVKGYDKLYQASTKDFTEGLQKIGKVAGLVFDGLSKIGSTFIELAEQVTGADMSFNGLAKSVIDYESGMKKVEQLTGASASQMKQLNDLALEQAKTTRYSAEEIAEGMTILGQAGLEVDAILGTLPSTLDLATAGGLEMAQATDIMTKSMNQFGMIQGKTAEEIQANATFMANVLTKASNASSTSVESIGEAMKYVGVQAHSMKIPVDQVATAIGVLANNGLDGAQAGTALRRILTQLANPTKNAKQAIKDFNLETAVSKIQSGNLTEGLKEMSDKFVSIEDGAERSRMAFQLVGQYGLTGLIALLGSGSKAFDDMTQKMDEAKSASEMADEYFKTLEGQMFRLTSTVGVIAIQAWQKYKQAIADAMGVVNDFIDLLSQGKIGQAFDVLAQASEKLKTALANGIQKAIEYVRDFVSDGGGFSSLLQVGTNIIQGIADGISRAKESGSLKGAIDGIITNLCNWINTNTDTIIQIGTDLVDAIAQGFEDNHGAVEEAIGNIWKIISSGNKWESTLRSIGKSFAKAMIDGWWESAKQGMANKVTELFSFIDGLTGASGKTPTYTDGDTGKTYELKTGKDGSKTWVEKGKSDANTYSQSFQEQHKVNNPYKHSAEQGREEIIGLKRENGRLAGQATVEGENQALLEEGAVIKETASRIGTDSSASIKEALDSMDTEQLGLLRQSIEEIGTATTDTATVMATAFTNIQNSARTAFTGLTNIVRNQMLNCTNIVKNQATNMADATRTSFVNMANIARNQFVNIANICRNQMLNCTNIVKNQMTNMNDATRTAFVNMANIVRNQMTNCTNIVRNQASNMSTALSQGMSKMASAAQSAMAKVVAAVQSGMAQARAIASAPITINIQSNISRKVTTTHVAGGLKQTMASIGANSLSVGSPNVMSSGGRHTITPVSGNGGSYTFTIPITVDGREIARATAKYNQSELDRLSKRNSRKRGE